MFRETLKEDIPEIVDLYNVITDRGRSAADHYWEWFESPYQNKTYIILKKDGTFVGHHGVLSLDLLHKDKVIRVGKTENTIIKKEYGAMYLKSEKAMLKEYKDSYELMTTTMADEKTTKLRKMLGYKVFSDFNYYYKILDYGVLSDKFFKGSFLFPIVNAFSKITGLFSFKKKIKASYSIDSGDLADADLPAIEELFRKVRIDDLFYQDRKVDFLKYRLLKNPYRKYEAVRLFKDKQLQGIIIYSIIDKVASIEDILYRDEEALRQSVNGLYNTLIERKNVYYIDFVVLKDSYLDKVKLPGFFKKNPKKNSNFMVRFGNTGLGFDIERFYMTRLYMEGIR